MKESSATFEIFFYLIICPCWLSPRLYKFILTSPISADNTNFAESHGCQIFLLVFAPRSSIIYLGEYSFLYFDELICSKNVPWNQNVEQVRLVHIFTIYWIIMYTYIYITLNLYNHLKVRGRSLYWGWQIELTETESHVYK